MFEKTCRTPKIQSEWPSPSERRDPAADERAADGGDEADRGQRDAAMVGVVAHVDQKRTRQRLRELVGELVEHDEREDLERAVAGEKADERLPHRVAERARAATAALPVRAPST